jgi:hypothetical protein
MNLLPKELYGLILKPLNLQNRQAFFAINSNCYLWSNDNNNWFCILLNYVNNLLYFDQNTNYRNLYYFYKFTEDFLKEDYDNKKNYEKKYMSLYLFLRNDNGKIETADQIKMTLKDVSFDKYSADAENLILHILDDIVSINDLVLYTQMVDELKNGHANSDFLHYYSRYAAYRFRANNILSHLNLEISFDDWIADSEKIVLFSSFTTSLLGILLEDMDSRFSDDFRLLKSGIGTTFFTVYIFELYCKVKKLTTLQDICENTTISEFVDIGAFSKINEVVKIGTVLCNTKGALYFDKIKLENITEDMLLDLYSDQHEFETFVKEKYGFYKVYR